MDNNHRLRSAINPASVVVVGASDREGSRGSYLWRSVMNSRRVLEAYPVNPKYKYIGLTPCWAKIADLPAPPDLAVIATSSRRVEGILAECAKAGIHNVLITPGEGEFTQDCRWRERLAAIAKKSRMRLVGVDSMGIIRPESGLNVSYWPRLPLKGHVGLICQTSTVGSAVLDYAEKYGFGFSSVINLGAETDVTLAEVIDCLAEDDETHLIAVDVFALHHPRAFFSAVHAATRKKPVVILHGSDAEGYEALTATRLNAPAAKSDALAVAIKKAGGTPTTSLTDFCGALHLLSQSAHPRGRRTAVLGNGVGATVLAAAALAPAGLTLGHPTNATHRTLAELLSSPAAAVDPTDAGPEAGPEHLASAARCILSDPEVDALLIALAPMAASGDAAAVEALSDTAEVTGKPVLVTRLAAPDINFEAAAARSGVPSFATPQGAASALALAQTILQTQQAEPVLSTPGSAAGTWDIDSARMLVEDNQRNDRFMLSESDASQLLHLYGIDSAPGTLAATCDDALAAARRIGYPVALKVAADGIARKTDAHGVLLNLKDDAAVASAFSQLKASTAKHAPYARFRGVWVQAMVHRPAGREFRLTLTTDPVLGPVIRLGVGGLAAGLFRDESVFIPPVTEAEVRASLDTFAAKPWLAALRGLPAANVESLIAVILRLSALAETQPAVTHLALSPLVVDDAGAIVLDAEGKISSEEAAADDKTRHLIFAGFPRRLHQPVRLAGGFVMIRSIRCDDGDGLQRFARNLTPEAAVDFFGKPAEKLTARDLTDLTSPDFDREVLLVAVDDSAVAPEIHAMVRLQKISAREGRLTSIFEARWDTSELRQALSGAVATAAERLALPLPKSRTTFF